MKADILRPAKCPHYSAGTIWEFCLHPSRSSPLLCDTAESARGMDGFPLNCPLRGGE